MPIHGMFLLGIRETAPPMSVKIHCFVFFNEECQMFLDVARPTCILPTSRFHK